MYFSMKFGVVFFLVCAFAFPEMAVLFLGLLAICVVAWLIAHGMAWIAGVEED